jgi:hypothetical protein
MKKLILVKEMKLHIDSPIKNCTSTFCHDGKPKSKEEKQILKLIQIYLNSIIIKKFVL